MGILELFKEEIKKGNHGFHKKEIVTGDGALMYQCYCEEWFNQMGDLMDHIHAIAKDNNNAR